MVNFLFGLFIGFSILGTYLKFNNKVVLDKKEHIRQCRRNMGIGYLSHKNKFMSLEESKKEWCR